MIARPVFAEHLLTTTSSSSELIFVTDITNYIRGEKIVMWRNFGKCWKIFGKFWRNFGKFWKILPQFTRFHVEKN